MGDSKESRLLVLTKPRNNELFTKREYTLLPQVVPASNGKSYVIQRHSGDPYTQVFERVKEEHNRYLVTCISEVDKPILTRDLAGYAPLEFVPLSSSGSTNSINPDKVYETIEGFYGKNLSGIPRGILNKNLKIRRDDHTSKKRADDILEQLESENKIVKKERKNGRKKTAIYEPILLHSDEHTTSGIA